MKQKSKTLDLTSDAWKSNPRWNKVGLEISKIPLTKQEKIANTAAAINVIIPATFWPVTSPLIIKAGRMMSINGKVKLR